LAPRAGAVELGLVPDSSLVEYHIDHTVSAVTDRAGLPSGRIDANPATRTVQTARVEVDLRWLRTGITQRDEHIHSAEYLDVAKFPMASFVLEAAEPDPASPTHVRARGTLSLHGVDRPVEIPLELVARDGALRVRGKFTITLADHGIKRPKKLVFSAGKTVDVRVDLLFAP
jgi:polyisoprenoid-binding protein YceI